MEALLTIKNYSFAYPGQDNYQLNDINLQIVPGECHCLMGSTGSGKSTLLLLIKGLLDSGRWKGEMIFHPSTSGRESNVGIVLQNPETQLLCQTIGSEIAFGLENLCVEPILMPEMVKNAASSIGLEMPLASNSSNLSMGQKYRLLLAAFLAMKSDLFLLDEPCAQLDQTGIEQLGRIIIELKRQGKSFLICEHNSESLKDVIDSYWKLDKEGRLYPEGESFLFLTPQNNLHLKPINQESKQEIIGVRDLAIIKEDNKSILSNVSFSINKGARIAIGGNNGAGKTTLLRALAGFLKPTSGQINVLGKSPNPEFLKGKVGYLFQNPQKQLFEDTVFQEVAFTLKRLGISKQSIQSKVEQVLTLINLSELSDKSPHKLSFGQQHLVALASILAYEPEIVLLDDPFAGLDKEYQELIKHVLVKINEQNKTTIVWTSHHSNFGANWANLSLQLNKGRLLEKYPAAA